MKKGMERFVLGLALAMIATGGTAFADSQSKTNQNAERSSEKPPSKWKLWKSQVKAITQQQIHMHQYIRGEGAPEYDAPVGHIPRQ